MVFFLLATISCSSQMTQGLNMRPHQHKRKIESQSSKDLKKMNKLKAEYSEISELIETCSIREKLIYPHQLEQLLKNTRANLLPFLTVEVIRNLPRTRRWWLDQSRINTLLSDKKEQHREAAEKSIAIEKAAEEEITAEKAAAIVRKSMDVAIKEAVKAIVGDPNGFVFVSHPKSREAIQDYLGAEPELINNCNEDLDSTTFGDFVELDAEAVTAAAFKPSW
jgi:hypothetical protein